MSNFRYTALLLACTLGANFAYAQTGKVATTLWKNSTQNAIKRSFSTTVRQNQLKMLESIRKASLKDPGYLQSLSFLDAAKNLQQMGLNLPNPPEWEASAEEFANYRKQVETLLFKESNALARQLHQKIQPLAKESALQTTLKQRQRIQLNSNFAQSTLALSNSPFLTWGTQGWDQVEIEPVDLSSFIILEGNQDLSDILEEIVAQSRDAYPAKMYDAILEHEHLNSAQKQQLITRLAEANTLLSYDFICDYMERYAEIPFVKAPSYNAGATRKGLEVYAATKQRDLIKKLQTAGIWTTEEWEEFSDLSVFLNPELAKAEISALTYLEPNAAIWLLENGLKNDGSQAILAQIQESKQNHKRGDGLIQKKALSQQFYELSQKYYANLSTYDQILYDRWEKLANQYALLHQRYYLLRDEGAAHDSDRDLMIQMRIAETGANLARLKQLLSQLEKQLEQSMQHLDHMAPLVK